MLRTSQRTLLSVLSISGTAHLPVVSVQIREFSEGDNGTAGSRGDATPPPQNPGPSGPSAPPSPFPAGRFPIFRNGSGHARTFRMAPRSGMTVWGDVVASARSSRRHLEQIVETIHQECTTVESGHPPVAAFNELFRLANMVEDHNASMDLVFKLSEIMSRTEMQPDAETFALMQESWNYFPRPMHGRQPRQ